MTQFEEMTNAQLKEACEDFGLEVIAKNPAKPNKAEYLTALNEFKVKQDEIHGVVPEEEKPEVKEPVKKNVPGSKRRPKTQAQLIKLDTMKKDRVIIRDMQESQTKDEMISFNWGNKMIGRHTDWVDLSGEPQYVRRGALYNIRDASMVVHTPRKGGGVDTARKKRFVVVDVEPLSDEEIKALAAQQAMRNSKQA